MTIRAASPGYTLLEVLITLVIIGLISGLLFEGLGGAAQTSRRIADRAAQLDRSAIASDWWRTSISSALPPQKGGAPNFIASSTDIQAFVAQSPSARPGDPHDVRWVLVPGDRPLLRYQSGTTSWDIARAPIRSTPYFAFLDEQGAWRRAWSDAKLPRLVALMDFFAYPVVARPRANFEPDQTLPFSSIMQNVE